MSCNEILPSDICNHQAVPDREAQRQHPAALMEGR
jgi:hypothetical protein